MIQLSELLCCAFVCVPLQLPIQLHYLEHVLNSTVKMTKIITTVRFAKIIKCIMCTLIKNVLMKIKGIFIFAHTLVCERFMIQIIRICR